MNKTDIMKWISVQNELPKLDTEVLITNGEWVHFGCIESDYYNCENDELEATWVGYGLGWDGESAKVEPTHWMPKPTPPNDNQNK